MSIEVLLVEALGADNRADLFIGGEVIRARSEVLLYRGNFEPLTVPLQWFASSPNSPEPDPAAFAVTDYGQTVRLGSYEASTDAILYEFDEDYRARQKADGGARRFSRRIDSSSAAPEGTSAS